MRRSCCSVSFTFSMAFLRSSSVAPGRFASSSAFCLTFSQYAGSLIRKVVHFEAPPLRGAVAGCDAQAPAPMYTPGEYGPESGWKPAAAHPATPSAMAMQMMIVAVILMAFTQ
jgi:hypothetical protein